MHCLTPLNLAGHQPAHPASSLTRDLLGAVNYLHWGEAKRWYAVPAAAAAAFEAAFRKIMPAKFEQQPDLLLQLITMLSPRTLQKLGVPLHATTQARLASEQGRLQAI